MLRWLVVHHWETESNATSLRTTRPRPEIRRHPPAPSGTRALASPLLRKIACSRQTRHVRAVNQHQRRARGATGVHHVTGGPSTSCPHAPTQSEEREGTVTWFPAGAEDALVRRRHSSEDLIPHRRWGCFVRCCRSRERWRRSTEHSSPQPSTRPRRPPRSGGSVLRKLDRHSGETPFPRSLPRNHNM